MAKAATVGVDIKNVVDHPTLTNMADGSTMNKLAGLFEEIFCMSDALDSVFDQAIGAGGDLDQYQVVALQVVAQKIDFLAHLGWEMISHGDAAAVDATGYFMPKSWGK